MITVCLILSSSSDDSLVGRTSLSTSSCFWVSCTGSFRSSTAGWAESVATVAPCMRLSSCRFGKETRRLRGKWRDKDGFGRGREVGLDRKWEKGRREWGVAIPTNVKYRQCLRVVRFWLLELNYEESFDFALSSGSGLWQRFFVLWWWITKQFIFIINLLF